MRLGFSPIIPTVASLLLAALWTLSVFAGWGQEAFCPGAPGDPADACSRRLATAATVSGLFAAAAACLTVAAWLLPSARPDPYRGHAPVPQLGLVWTGVAAWVAAEGVLFLGGLLAK